MKNNSVILSGGRLSTFRHNGSGEISVEAIYGNRITIAVDGSVTVLTTRGTIIRIDADGKVSEHLKT
jgi:hypothetical protein